MSETITAPGRGAAPEACDPAVRVTRSLLGYGVIAGPIYLCVGLAEALNPARVRPQPRRSQPAQQRPSGLDPHRPARDHRADDHGRRDRHAPCHAARAGRHLGTAARLRLRCRPGGRRRARRRPHERLSRRHTRRAGRSPLLAWCRAPDRRRRWFPLPGRRVFRDRPLVRRPETAELGRVLPRHGRGLPWPGSPPLPPEPAAPRPSWPCGWRSWPGGPGCRRFR